MRRTAILLGAGLTLIIPLADMVLNHVGDRAALAMVTRTLGANGGLSIGRVAFDPWQNSLTIEDLSLVTPTAAVRIGHLAYAPKARSLLSFVSPALAEDGNNRGNAAASKDAGTITAENVVIDGTEATYHIARIELAGTDLHEEDLKNLLDAKNTSPLAERLSKLSAAKIAISEASIAQKGQSTNATFVYRDVELTNVAKAYVGDGKIAALNVTLTSPDAETATATCGPVRIKGYNIAQNIKIMSEKAGNAEQPQPLYDSFAVAKCELNLGNATIEIASLSLANVKGRPLRLPVETATEIFGRDQDVDDPELVAKRRAYLADIYSSIEAAAFDAADVQITSTQDGTPTFSFGKISLAHFADSKIGELRFDGMNVAAKGNKLKLGDGVFRAVNLVNIGKILTRQASDPVEPMPVLDQFSIEGLDVDAADNGTDAADGAAHTRFQIAKLDMTGADAIGGIPTRFAMGLDHFTADTRDLGPSEWGGIANLGYTKIDLSGKFAMHFDPGKEELAFEELSVNGTEMGSLKLSGQFSNVSSDLFSPDQSLAEAALLTSLINHVDIKVENGGLLEKIIAANAKKSGKSADEIRRNYIAAVSIGVPAMLENGPNAKAIGAALAKFIAAPKTLHIVARSPDGLGASDFALIKQPGALMDKLEIQATANE
jgi:hypothetical protein